MTTLIFKWKKLNLYGKFFKQRVIHWVLDACGKDINGVLSMASRTHFKCNLKEIKKENSIFQGKQQQKPETKLSMWPFLWVAQIEWKKHAELLPGEPQRDEEFMCQKSGLIKQHKQWSLLSLNDDRIQNGRQWLILKVLRKREKWKLFGR